MIVQYMGNISIIRIHSLIKIENIEIKIILQHQCALCAQTATVYNRSQHWMICVKNFNGKYRYMIHGYGFKEILNLNGFWKAHPYVQ
jgi:5-methylcytosine-specific restriction endonuclease McrA